MEGVIHPNDSFYVEWGIEQDRWLTNIIEALTIKKKRTHFAVLADILLLPDSWACFEWNEEDDCVIALSYKRHDQLKKGREQFIRQILRKCREHFQKQNIKLDIYYDDGETFRIGFFEDNVEPKTTILAGNFNKKIPFF